MKVSKERAKNFYTKLHIKPVKSEKEALTRQDALSGYYEQPRYPKKHSGIIVDSFDGGLEVTLWGDPKGDALSYEISKRENYIHPMYANMPELGREILEVWRFCVRYSMNPVKLSEISGVDCPETRGIYENQDASKILQGKSIVI